jgi:hypothetical protein
MDMIERVARAIDPESWKVVEDYCDAKDYSPHDRAIVFEDSERIQGSLRKARAAIEAMRPVDEAMRIAAVNTQLPGIGEPPLYEKLWQAMIDAALTPSPASK